MTRIGIIVGTTRPGRRGRIVAEWVLAHASQRSDATFELVDLADFGLPNLDEPAPAAMGPRYTNSHTRAWAEAIGSMDGFVIVTPEYNHSISGVLKNALDFLYVEWHNKAVGFVGYGLAGATRAVEHLRQIAGELQLADVRQQVALSLFSDFENWEAFTPGDHHDATLNQMLDQLVAWSTVFEPLRSKAKSSADSH